MEINTSTRRSPLTTDLLSSRLSTAQSPVPVASVDLSCRTSPYGRKLSFYKYGSSYMGSIEYDVLPAAVDIPSKTHLLSNKIWKGVNWGEHFASHMYYAALNIYESASGNASPSQKASTLDTKHFVYVKIDDLCSIFHTNKSTLVRMSLPLISQVDFIASRTIFLNIQDLDRNVFSHSQKRVKEGLKLIEEEAPRQVREVQEVFSQRLSTLYLHEIRDSAIYFTLEVLNSQLTWITTLKLIDLQLCDLPENLGDLQHLIILDCRKNLLTQLPASICRISTLRKMLLQGNQFEVFDCAGMRNMTALTHIDLRSNPLEFVSEYLFSLERFLFDISDTEEESANIH